MKKEFIPYSEALALKELGFDEEQCFARWTTYPDGEGYLDTTTKSAFQGQDSINKRCLAPLYQQASRWFREKYGLYSHVRESLGFDDTLEFVAQINGSYVNHGVFDKPVNRFDTYEEAELECLKKLIEIVKNK